MKYKFLLVAFSAALITGCSTAYQAGQTPDDVYYSPAREGLAREEVRRERNNDRYETYTSSEDDNYLRMRIRNRNRWNTIDDFDYWYNPYNSPYYSYSPYGRFSLYNSPNFIYNGPMWNTWGWNGYNNFGWDSYRWNNYGWGNNFYGHGIYGGGFNNGFYPGVVIKNPVRTTSNVSRPSLGSYRNSNYNNNNTRRPLGETLNKVFSAPPSNGGYSNANTTSSRTSTYEAPSRTYNPPASSSSSSSGSSSSGSSSGGAVSRPPR